MKDKAIKIYSWEKTILVFLSGIVVLLSFLGFYLAKTEIPEPFGHLVSGGHSHALCFAFAAFFYLALLRIVKIPSRFKKVLTYSILITFLEPLGLLWAGLAKEMRLLPLSSGIGGGTFILLWLLMTYFLLPKTGDLK